jgi:hypothetical protein
MRHIWYFQSVQRFPLKMPLDLTWFNRPFLHHAFKKAEFFGNLEILKCEIHIFIKVFRIRIELSKNATIKVAILQNNGLPPNNEVGFSS